VQEDVADTMIAMVAGAMAELNVGDPAILVASSAKARELLGWKPRRAAITQIVEDAWRWHQSPRF